MPNSNISSHGSFPADYLSIFGGKLKKCEHNKVFFAKKYGKTCLNLSLTAASKLQAFADLTSASDKDLLKWRQIVDKGDFDGSGDINNGSNRDYFDSEAESVELEMFATSIDSSDIYL